MADEAKAARRLVMRREAAAFRRYEAAMLRAYDAVLTVTEEDRSHLLALFPEPERPALAAKFTVIPICVDPEAIAPVTPSPQSAIRNPSAPFRTGPQSVLHLGTMFWPPNVAGVLWFAREVLPLVWREAPETRFVVVGKNPPREVQALAADGRIEVTGYVADPLPHLQVADAFVVPLFSGGGMRVKIVDAWLWGLPIVSTPVGAEGIEIRDGENILIAGDAPAFAAAVVRLLTDKELNRRLRIEGRRWVEERYAWQSVYRRVDAVYERLLAERDRQSQNLS
jgi:glycosyltransferase involved in cell wall biosynthesis